MRTVPIGIQLLMGQHSYEWNQIMAMSILGSIPVLVLFLVFQRFFISGLTAGSSERRHPTRSIRRKHQCSLQATAFKAVAHENDFAIPAFNISRSGAMFQGIIEDDEDKGAPAHRRDPPDEVGHLGVDDPGHPRARAPLVGPGRDPLGPRRELRGDARRDPGRLHVGHDR